MDCNQIVIIFKFTTVKKPLHTFLIEKENIHTSKLPKNKAKLRHISLDI